MKKTKLIALTLAVAIMLMGAGYAYWTDSLKIENYVETGEMNVEFIAPHYPLPELECFSDYVVVEPVDRDTKSVQFTFKNLYPGVRFNTLTEMQNKGTIPAVFDNAVVTFSEDADNIIKNNLNVQFNCLVFDENGYIIEILNGAYTTVANLENALNAILANVRLEPGQYLTFQGDSIDQFMMYELNPNLTNGELTTLKFDITVNWKQHNAN